MVGSEQSMRLGLTLWSTWQHGTSTFFGVHQRTFQSPRFMKHQMLSGSQEAARDTPGPGSDFPSSQRYRLFGERRVFDAWIKGKNRREMMLEEWVGIESSEPDVSPGAMLEDSMNTDEFADDGSVRLRGLDMVVLKGQPCEVTHIHFKTDPPLVLLRALWEGLLQKDPDFWSQDTTGSRYSDVAELLPATQNEDGRILWLPWPQPEEDAPKNSLLSKADARPFNETDLGPLLMKLRALALLDNDPGCIRDASCREWLEELRRTVRDELQSIQPVHRRRR
eukprot:TRINITY_DN33370_c0_g1_i1.p1 TRINITY_DN33370_c0_g1~~TRINITY_DN33370_c0_g1_i1.p1  ORF type:complete len:279 (-),score=49.52 TRINITY_DN33370_c0_g1_i1:127-963(-)